MKNIYESILSSTGTGGKSILDKFFSEATNNCDFEVKGNKVTVKSLDWISWLCEDGELYAVKGRNFEIRVKFPSGFVFEKIPFHSVLWNGGKLPRAFYGTEFDCDDDGMNQGIQISFPDKSPTGIHINDRELSIFIEDILHKTTGYDEVSFNTGNFAVKMSTLTNHDFGGRNISIFQYGNTEQPLCGLPMHTIKGLKCKKLTVGFSNKRWLSFSDMEESEERRILLSGDGIQNGSLKAVINSKEKHPGENYFDIEYMQQKLMELSMNNNIEYLNILTNNSQAVCNIFWDKNSKAFDSKIEKSWAKRLGKFNKVK